MSHGEELWEQFPLSQEAVNDPSLQWPVGGAFKALPSEDEFTAAFSTVDIPKGWKPVTRASFVKLAGWKQQQAVEALRAPPPYTYSFPHSEVVAVDIIKPVDWSSCVGVQRSDDGSEGVLFVELPGKRAVVVKAPLHVASEMFGNVICGNLGIAGPTVRLVASASEEGRCLHESLIKADSLREPQLRKVQAMLAGRPMYLVMEYVQATPLVDLFGAAGLSWAQRDFGVEPLSDRGMELLRTLGMFVAFDMIINNFDRLPCVWDNQGNAGNIMFTAATAEPISIDNMVCCISPEHTDAFAKYMERVREVTVDCIHHVDAGVEQLEFSKIRTFFRDGCVDGQGWTGLGVDIGVEGSLQVQTGFLNFVKFAAHGEVCSSNRGGLTLKWLEQVRDALLQQLPADLPLSKAPPHLYGFVAVHPEFCAAVVDAFRGALQEAAEATGGRLGVAASEPQPMGGTPKARAMRLDSTSGVFWDADMKLPLFMTPEMQQTLLDSHEARRALMREDASRLLQPLPDADRKALAQQLRRPPNGFHPVELLARVPPWPQGVAADRREQYLSPDDFQQVFGMSKVEFSKLPLWTQQHRKKKVNLF